MNERFLDTKTDVLNARFRFQGKEQYVDLVKNQDLNKISQQFDLYRKSLKHSADTETNDAKYILAVDASTKSYDKKFAELIQQAEINLTDVAKGAVGKLYSQRELNAGSLPLVNLIYDKFQKSSISERNELTKNPQTAGILSHLNKHGLVPDSTREVVNRTHSPEAMAILDNVESDGATLHSMKKEITTFRNGNYDEKAANEMRTLENNRIAQ